ncbi:MAG: ABC transporter ATP-binding protein [bacterium]
MLEIRNLTCGYENKIILQDVDFEMDESEFFGVIGPNGSGKTTFFRAITKIVNPVRGSILLDGFDINKMSCMELAKNISVVSQNANMDLMMTVEEFVFLGRIPHRKKFQFFETRHDEKIACDVMEITDTLKFRNRTLGSLSGGERHLACIARSLCQEPRLLLLDEPTNQLDIAHQVRIMDLIKRMNRERGITVIIVLHDLNLASEYCGRLMLFNNGKIHKIGMPEEVLTYQTIEEVYKTMVLVEKNPVSKKPYVFLVSENNNVNNKKGESGFEGGEDM